MGHNKAADDKVIKTRRSREDTRRGELARAFGAGLLPNLPICAKCGSKVHSQMKMNYDGKIVSIPLCLDHYVKVLVSRSKPKTAVQRKVLFARLLTETAISAMPQPRQYIAKEKNEQI